MFNWARTNEVATWPPIGVYGAALGVLILGVLLGILIWRRRGNRELRSASKHSPNA